MIKKCKPFYTLCIAATYSLLLSAGCSGIPSMVPDMEMRPAKTLRLEGARGPLSATQSKAILARLKKNGSDTNIFDKHLALESEIVGSPLVIGNKVDLLIDGPTTYAAMFKAIEAARDHINLETFIIENDEIGQRFIDALVQKQRSGVQVNLIYDSVGSMNTPKDFFSSLIESGGQVLEFNPINPLNARKAWLVTQRDHRKLLIVDGQVAFVGGINISSVYSSGSRGASQPKPANVQTDVPWRDTHLRVAGPVVKEFQKLFIGTWEQQSDATLPARNYLPMIRNQSNAVVRAIGSAPDELFSQIYVTLLSAINSAESSIFITNAYFVPDPQLLEALKDASKRGVAVTLILPGKTDSQLVYYASRSFYDELLQAGVKIHERQHALLHAKTAVIDGVWSTIGSTNLDWRSFVSNQEINAVVLGQDFGLKMQSLFERDLASSKAITLEAWRKRSITMRIKERAARLWARLL